MKHNHGKRMVKENLIAEIGKGTEYTAGTGIDIEEGSISVDTDTVALKEDIPTVTGTNDGTSWTSLTIDEDTYDIPQGAAYTFTNGLTESGGTVSWNLNNKFNYGLSGRSIVSSDASNFDANNACQNSCIYMPNGSLSPLSNNRYNNSIIAFGNGLSKVSNPNLFVESLVLYGTGLEASVDSTNKRQIIIGSNNVADASKALIIGDGASATNKHNLMTVDRDGNLECNNMPAVNTATDGTYVLKATVSSGVVTYAWVLEQ